MGIVLRGQDQYRPLFKIDYRLPIVDVCGMGLDYIHAEAKDLNIYQSKSLAFLRANLELNGKPEGATLPFLQSKPECMRCCLRAVYWPKDVDAPDSAWYETIQFQWHDFLIWERDVLRMTWDRKYSGEMLNLFDRGFSTH
jgi:hypothetical protein